MFLEAYTSSYTNHAENSRRITFSLHLLLLFFFKLKSFLKPSVVPDCSGAWRTESYALTVDIEALLIQFIDS